ncbi:MAG TPA: hypothetical protein PLS20_02015 [Ruminococcus flavefaciens]|nr:hypothetical protein [Ruminococcus flavefaciens]
MKGSSGRAVFRMFLVLLIGAVCIFFGASDAYIWFSGKKIDLNDSKRMQYNAPSGIVGEVFAVQSVMKSEETFREYGVIPVKRKVNYYLVTNLMREDWAKAISSAEYGLFDDGFYTLVRVSDKERIEAFDKASEKTERYISKLVSGSYSSAVPSVSIKIDGKLMAQRTDSDYIKARDTWLENAGVSSDLMTEYIISDETSDKKDAVLALGGAALVLISLIGMIVQAVKNISDRKKEKQKHVLY